MGLFTLQCQVLKKRILLTKPLSYAQKKITWLNDTAELKPFSPFWQLNCLIFEGNAGAASGLPKEYLGKGHQVTQAESDLA